MSQKGNIISLEKFKIVEKSFMWDNLLELYFLHVVLNLCLSSPNLIDHLLVFKVILIQKIWRKEARKEGNGGEGRGTYEMTWTYFAHINNYNNFLSI